MTDLAISSTASLNPKPYVAGTDEAAISPILAVCEERLEQAARRLAVAKPKQCDCNGYTISDLCQSYLTEPSPQVRELILRSPVKTRSDALSVKPMKMPRLRTICSVCFGFTCRLHNSLSKPSLSDSRRSGRAANSSSKLMGSFSHYCHGSASPWLGRWDSAQMPSEYPNEPSWNIVFNIILIFILAILAAMFALNAPVPL